MSTEEEPVKNKNSFKVVIVGDGMVGKTSILMSFIYKKFPTEYVPTVLETYAHTLTVDDEKVSDHLSVKSLKIILNVYQLF